MLWALLVCVTLLATVSVAQGAKNAIVHKSRDFQYDSFKVFSLRINPYDETLSPTGLVDELGLSKYYGHLEANQFPSFLAMMTPITIFPPAVANVVWCIINLILTALMLVLMRKLFCPGLPKTMFFIACCLMLFGLGWRNNIGMGQHTIFSLFFFLLAMYLSEKQRSVFSGTMLAISFFKYTLTVPLALYFVYKRKFRELLVSVVIHIALTIFSVFWLNDSIINLLLKPMKITTWLGAEGYIDFSAIFNLKGPISLILTATVMFAFLALAIFLHRKQQESQATDYNFFALLCYMALVVTYHRAYDFFVWIIPCLIYLFRYYTTKQQKIEMIVSTVLFAYSNFLNKALHMLLSIRPSFANYLYLFDYVLAFITYAFIIYLAVGIVAKKKHHAIFERKQTIK